MKKLLFALFALTWSISLFAQSPHYKMPNGKIIDSVTYLQVKERLAQKGKVEEIIISRIRRHDSLIITPKLNILTVKDENGNYIDPYAAQKKLIGKAFPISLFKNESGISYSSDFLKGKPSLINFWFTTCVPCIAEIPTLNQLSTELKGTVNLLAISFEKRQTVEQFLKNQKWNFSQITDAQTALKHLKFEAYPTTFILDKNGIVVDVWGDIGQSKQQALNTLKDLMVLGK